MFCNTSIDLICKLQVLEVTDEQEDILRSINYWLNGVFGGTIAIIGLIMNSLTASVLFSMKETKHMMSYLLCFLLITNNVFLLTQFLNILVYNFGVKECSIMLPNVVYPLEKTSLTMAVFWTISLAHEAYLITWHHDVWCHVPSSSDKSFRKKMCAYSIPIILTAFVINIPRWFSKSLTPSGKSKDTSLKTNFYYVVYYENFVLNILTVFVPITLLIFFNWSVRNFIKKKQSEMNSTLSSMQDISQSVSNDDGKKKAQKKATSKDTHQTNILIMIIIIFIACHFPRCILKFSDGFPKSIGIKILETCERVLLIVNASATPFIYLSKNKRFRGQLMDSLRCRSVSSDQTNGISIKSVITGK